MFATFVKMLFLVKRTSSCMLLLRIECKKKLFEYLFNKLGEIVFIGVE